MKPTPQISSKQGDQPTFPVTDYHFQSAVEAHAASTAIATETRAKREVRTFRKLSREFLGYEISRDYFAELALFIFIAGVAAWPIITMIVAVTRMVRGW